MFQNMVVLILVLSAIVTINCERYKDCFNCKSPEYVRLKANYYGSPPQRIYRRPPMVQPVPGIFSYTPPPPHMKNDPKNTPFRPYKVSKKPIEDMDDTDLSNIVNNLSNNDLKKLIDMAEKDRLINRFNQPERDVRVDMYKANVQEINGDNFKPYYNDDRINNYVKESSQPKLIYTLPPPNVEIAYDNFNNQGPIKQIHNVENYDRKPVNDVNYQRHVNDLTLKNNLPVKYENSQISTHQSEIDMNEMKQYYNFVQVFNEMATKGDHVFTDSSIMKEEELPKPINLREDEYIVSQSRKVPTVVAAGSSYELKNFGDLPLMYQQNTKLDSVSSYKVPHYTVTKTKSHPSGPKILSSPSKPFEVATPEIEYAPPDATGHEQSDAHLRAVKIWTHKSKGTAYTLHDDGTLSLEKPFPSKYGH